MKNYKMCMFTLAGEISSTFKKSNKTKQLRIQIT